MLGVGRTPLCNRRKTQICRKIEDRKNKKFILYSFICIIVLCLISKKNDCFCCPNGKNI